MALDVETGTFDKTTGAGPQNVSVGFDPKALIIWGVKNATTNADTANHASYSVGFVDDADNQRVNGEQIEDGVAAVDGRRQLRSDSAILFFSDGTGTIDVRASIALGTAQFTITYAVNDSNASKMHWMAFGGSDITGVQCSHFTKSSTTPSVIQSITTDADCQNITAGEGVLFMMMQNRTTVNQTGNNPTLTLGIATKTTERGLVGASNDDAAASSEPRQTSDESFITRIWNPASGTLIAEGDFDGFDSLGFDIDWSNNDTTSQLVPFLIIKGGKWQAGNETTKITTTGTKATTTDFQPKGLFVIGVRRTASGGPTQEDLSLNIGAAASTTTETSGGYSDENTADPIQIGIMSSITKVVRVMDATDQSVFSEAELDSFNATDFTLDYTTVDANAYKFTWLVCGDEAAAPIVKVEPEILDLVEGAIAVIGPVKVNDEILDLPEGSLAHRARVFLAPEILDLSEVPNFVRGRIKQVADILDLPEGSLAHRARVFLKDEVLELAEGAVSILGLVKLKDEILDLAEGAVNVLGLVKLKAETLDLPEQANGLLTKVMETLELVEGAISKTVVNIIANEILDIPEGTSIKEALVRLKSEALELVEGSIFTRALTRLKAEILHLVEGSVAHRGRVFVADEILDIPETEFSVLGIVKVSDETLDLVEDSLSILGIVKVADEVLDLPEARNFIRGRIKVNPEVLDLPEGTAKTMALVRLNPEILDLSEASIRIIGFPKIVDETLDLVEGTVFTRALVRLKAEILDLVEGSVIAKGVIRLKAEVLDLVESALALVPVAGVIVKIASEILDLAESAIAKFRAVDFRKAIPGITFTRGTDAVGTARGTDAIVLNRGTDARLIAENQ